MIRRKFLAASATAAILFVFASTPARALDEQAATVFVNQVTQDVVKEFGGRSLTRAQVHDAVDRLVQRYIDLPQLSQDILGRYWARATEDERARFQALVIDYVMSVWGGEMNDMSPKVTIAITRTEPAGERVVVHTVASTPGDDPLPVEWVVGSRPDGRAVIADVTFEGVSPVKTMRDDFSSFLRANGGRVEALLAGMQKKIDSAVAAK
jgi:phospholipid transport system substrate-binding protein